MRQQPVLQSIQYLRALAAMTVAVYHVGNHAGVSFEVGAAGVDLFFVISGFIMWLVTSGRPGDPASFIVDRVTRIAPPYVLLTIGTYLTARFIPAVFPNMQTSLSHAVLSALFIPHIDPQGTAFPQIVSGWTLNYEMFFYAVFALCLFVPKRGRAWACSLLLVVLTAVGALLPVDGAAAAAYTSPLLLEFCAGLWLGVAWGTGRAAHAGWGVAALIAGFGGLAAWQLVFGTDPGPWRALVWGCPAVLTVGGALTVERASGVRTSRMLLLVGNASFSIYLVNAFTTAGAWRLMRHAPLAVYYCGGVVASAAGGIVFWYLVERPLTRVLRRAVHRPTPVVETAPPPPVPAGL